MPLGADRKYCMNSEMFIYRLLHIVIRLMSYIPFSLGQFFGKMLGTAIAMLPMNRNAVSSHNIQESFGHLMDKSQIRKLNRRVLVHFGQTLFEVPHIFRLNPANLEKYVTFVNENYLLDAFKKGRGVFFLTGHFGNWELMSAAISIRFGPGAIVVRPLDFSPLERLINDLRTRFGAEVIPKQRGMRRIIEAIKKNKAVGILLDQNVDWYEGVFVDFLGRWACTNSGLAVMALKMDTPVITAFSVRQKDGRYRIIIGKEVSLIRTGDKRRDVEENTALFTAVIGKYVQEYPDHWFWFHRRWKTKNFCPLP